MAALSTGESVARRKRALIGPWIDIKKPARTMTRTGTMRILQSTIPVEVCDCQTVRAAEALALKH